MEANVLTIIAALSILLPSELAAATQSTTRDLEASEGKSSPFQIKDREVSILLIAPSLVLGWIPTANQAQVRKRPAAAVFDE